MNNVAHSNPSRPYIRPSRTVAEMPFADRVRRQLTWIALAAKELEEGGSSEDAVEELGTIVGMLAKLAVDLDDFELDVESHFRRQDGLEDSPAIEPGPTGAFETAIDAAAEE